MCCKGLHGLANPAYLRVFFFPALPSIAPYCVPDGNRVVSGGRKLRVAGSFALDAYCGYQGSTIPSIQASILAWVLAGGPAILKTVCAARPGTSRRPRRIVAPLVGVAVLDGYPDGLLERHRILDVEPVEADMPAPIVASAQGDAVVRSGVFLLRAPGGVEVVFGAGAVQGRRPLLAVDEDHVVSLPVPVPLLCLAEVAHVQDAADVVTASLGFQDRVVALARGVLATEQELLVALPCVLDPVGGVLPVP